MLWLKIVLPDMTVIMNNIDSEKHTIGISIDRFSKLSYLYFLYFFSSTCMTLNGLNMVIIVQFYPEV